MTDLKAFAEATYARPGVAAAALRLQERYAADINLLLTAAWLAEQGYCLEPQLASELAADCREWRHAVLLPQRSVRRQLKTLAPLLYSQALELELAMERWQLDRMTVWLGSRIRARSPVDRTGSLATLLEPNLEAAFLVSGEKKAERGLADLAELAHLLLQLP